MRFEEAYEGWNGRRLTQSEAAQILGMCERSFRRYLTRYEAEGLQGLLDRRLEQVSHRRAPVDEVMALTLQYRSQHTDWNVKHSHNWYGRSGGTRSYTWVKKRLQEARTEATKVSEDLASNLYKLDERQSILGKTVLTAPIAGVVKFLKLTTIGGVLRAGDELMQISPTEGEMVFEVKINPADIGQLSTGRRASR